MSFKKTGEVTSKYLSNVSMSQDYVLKTMSDGAVFAKIFEHNVKSGTVLFTSIDEVKRSSTQDKFSRLGELDYFKPTNGKYEFILEYPDNTTAYNRWKQTNNPMKEFVTETSAGTGTAAGYEAVHIDWTINHWGGLTRQLSNPDTKPSNTYLSGSVGHGNWYYAIGCMQNFNNGMPAYDGGTSGRAVLWVRVDTLSVDKFNIFKSNTICATDFIEI